MTAQVPILLLITDLILTKGVSVLGYSQRLPEIVHVKIKKLRKCAQLAFPLQLFLSKNYEDYQNDVSMQENDGHCNAELVDGDFAQVESNLIVR